MPSFEGSSAGHQFIIGTSIGGQSTGHLLENHQTNIYWRSTIGPCTTDYILKNRH